MVIAENFPYNNEFFAIFEQICKIPHGSGNTEAIADYCVNFAEQHDAEAFKDSAGNVLIKKGGTDGKKRATPVIIQGHLDMVCEKTVDSKHDFLRDPLKLKFDGKYISAVDTTLGGDDGIAVAFALALIADKETPLPPLEVLLTSDEETGLCGAIGLDGTLIEGKELINIDSEEEGMLLCGCAGGITAKIRGEAVTRGVEGALMTFKLSGLAGGHSGVEIDKCRINAAKCLANILSDVGLPYRLVLFKSGGKNNAIPCNAAAEIVTDERYADEFKLKAEAIFANIQPKSAEDKPRFSVDMKKDTTTAADEEDSRRITDYLCRVPDGVTVSDENGPVTSLNTGIADFSNGSFYSEALLRSRVNDDIDKLSAEVSAVASKYGFSISLSDRYPAWEYKADSALRDKMVEVFEATYCKKPEVATIHAGLECGILSKKIDGLDAVSFGPDILNVHTVNEKLDALSAVRSYEYLLNILKAL